MRAAHRANPAGILRTELDETALARDAVHRGDAHAQDIIARGPVARQLKDLTGVHIGVIDREKGTGFGERMFQIGAVMRHKMLPIPPPHLLGVNGVRETQGGGRGRARDPLPFVMEMRRVVLLLRADLIGRRRILGLRCGGVHRRGPLEVTPPGIGAFLEPLLDTLIGAFDLDAELPFLLRTGRDEPREVLIQRLPPEREILLELVARHEKRRAHRIEGPRASIGRQFARRHGHAEEVADRVLVFATVEPPHRDFPARVGELVARGHEGAGEGIKEIRLRCRIRLLFILRRHFARVDGVQHLLPQVGFFDRVHAERDVIEPHFALLLLGVVAAQAVVFEEGTVFGVESGLRCVGGAEEDQRSDDKGGKDRESRFHVLLRLKGCGRESGGVD